MSAPPAILNPSCWDGTTSSQVYPEEKASRYIKASSSLLGSSEMEEACSLAGLPYAKLSYTSFNTFWSTLRSCLGLVSGVTSLPEQDRL